MRKILLPVIISLTLAASMAQVSRGPITRAASYLMDGATVMIGTASSLATVGGTLTTSTTAACTIADTNETTLWTYTLPAGAVNANGRGVRITTWGLHATNANGKTLRLYFGATVVQTFAGNFNGTAFKLVSEVIRTGAATQASMVVGVSGGNIATASASPTETLASAVVIKITAQNSVATASDLCFAGAIVETIK